jgi:hypothetical protein
MNGLVLQNSATPLRAVADHPGVRDPRFEKPLLGIRTSELHLFVYNWMYNSSGNSSCSGRTNMVAINTVQVIGRRPHTTEAWVRVWDSWWAMWHREKFTTDFFGFPLSISYQHPHNNISSGGWTMRPSVVAVQRHSHTPSTMNKQQQQ